MGNPLQKYHPLTNALIVPIGYLPNGRAVWPIMGGDDTVEPATAPDAHALSDADQRPPAQDPAPADDGKGGKDAILGDLAKERDKRQALEQQVTELQNAQQSQLDAIAKALGLKSDDTPPDPQALAAQVTTEQQKAREAAVQLAVYRNATKGGGNPDALLDSASFLRSVAELDPNDVEAVTEAIKVAVSTNPRLAAADVPAPGAVGIGVMGVGQPLDPRSADLAQIQRDLAAAKNR